MDVALKRGKTTSTIGDDVGFRGIPYYMAQLNEFVRTFSANVNQIQNTGYDLYQEKGCDLFVAAPLAEQSMRWQSFCTIRRRVVII